MDARNADIVAEAEMYPVLSLTSLCFFLACLLAYHFPLHHALLSHTSLACFLLVLGALPLLLRHQLVLDGLDRRQIARLLVDACVGHIPEFSTPTINCINQSPQVIIGSQRIDDRSDTHTQPDQFTPLSARSGRHTRSCTNNPSPYTQHMRTLYACCILARSISSSLSAAIFSLFIIFMAHSKSSRSCVSHVHTHHET